MQASGLDPEREDLPQDGRTLIEVQGRKIDARVSVSPVVHGRAVAIRLLDRASISLALDQLGMEPGDTDLQERPLAGVADALLHLRGRLLVRILDGRRMDAAVGNESLQSDAGDLAAPVEEDDGRPVGEPELRGPRLRRGKRQAYPAEAGPWTAQSTRWPAFACRLRRDV